MAVAQLIANILAFSTVFGPFVVFAALPVVLILLGQQR